MKGRESRETGLALFITIKSQEGVQTKVEDVNYSRFSFRPAEITVEAAKLVSYPKSIVFIMARYRWDSGTQVKLEELVDQAMDRSLL